MAMEAQSHLVTYVSFSCIRLGREILEAPVEEGSHPSDGEERVICGYPLRSKIGT